MEPSFLSSLNPHLPCPRFEARGVLVEDMTRGVKFMHQVYRCVRLPGLIGGRKGASTTID